MLDKLIQKIKDYVNDEERRAFFTVLFGLAGVILLITGQFPLIAAVLICIAVVIS